MPLPPPPPPSPSTDFPRSSTDWPRSSTDFRLPVAVGAGVVEVREDLRPLARLERPDGVVAPEAVPGPVPLRVRVPVLLAAGEDLVPVGVVPLQRFCLALLGVPGVAVSRAGPL